MSTNTKERRASARAHQTVEVGAPLTLAQFSTPLPPQLPERLRIAAPQLGLRQSDITAAVDEYLRRYEF
jgi:hypothetical protein